MLIKKFKEWFFLKEKLHISEHVPPTFKEGEIWWCYLGENVDIEVNGKGVEFARPVLVFKKYNKYSFFGLPFTTKQKTGTWYHSFTHEGKFQNINLSQGRSLSYKRLRHLLGQVDSVRFQAISNNFIELHKT